MSVDAVRAALARVVDPEIRRPITELDMVREVKALQPIIVRREVIANSRHDAGITTQHLQRVGNVAGATAELTPHVGDQKGDVEDVQLVRKDVVFEAVVEHHDGVVGH